MVNDLPFYQELYKKISKQSNDKVNALCIGDIMLDKFIYGTVERISPEAPVPVFLHKEEKMMLGGAGNVALNLSALNCNVTLLGVVGQDHNAALLAHLVKNSEIKHHFLKIQSLPTIVKTRIIANNQHLLRIDNEERYNVPISIIPRLTKALKGIIKNQDIVILSDYNKGIFNLASCQMIIKLCNELGIKVLVDPKGTNYEKYRNAYLVKPNLKEFKEATGIKDIDPRSNAFLDDIKLGADLLYKKYNISHLIVTLGEHGMVYVSANEDQIIHLPTIAKEVYDVSGAGDTSLAALGMSLAKGFDIKSSMILANIASGIVVGKLGTATVSLLELCVAVEAYINEGI